MKSQLIAIVAAVNAVNQPIQPTVDFTVNGITKVIRPAKQLNGKTPLDSAVKDKRTETADLLRKHGGKTGEELEAVTKPTPSIT